ncbi:expressed unknown protein [Seminavis robusta]|uniref:Uncharacterized protein n=1 Tax=Seminavis robusta TaxID=568900 RepID=A0A9N8DFU4_9STRA|nr:expressed unknown protein [Seminavis robusta]|eukprot:Sro137_g064360.1 n/a (68) ;mRNA; r:42938-43298
MDPVIRHGTKQWLCVMNSSDPTVSSLCCWKETDDSGFVDPVPYRRLTCPDETVALGSQCRNQFRNRQ